MGFARIALCQQEERVSFGFLIKEFGVWWKSCVFVKKNGKKSLVFEQKSLHQHGVQKI
jgi:hypothetical protein